jgi:hypothetical protein
MKLAKSLLLGSAAGLVAVTGAQAADLPVRAAAPVDYVRTCPNAPIGGTGFFVIPGTETCLQISGYVRAEYRFAENLDTAANRTQDDIQFFTRGSIAFDARTPTEYGTLRSFIRINGDRGVAGAEDAYLDQGFIQFAGLTAGRITSFFSFFGGNMMTSNAGLTDPSVEVLAYTATFGSGFSATISVEDGLARRQGIAGGPAYGGQELPDLVANLNVTQAWGSAQIMGAIHQIRHNVPNVIVDDELGFAIGAGLNVRLPMIAAGDALWLQATYTDGAFAYSGAPNVVSDFTVGRNDAYLNAAGTSLVNTETWSIVAAFRHYWTPTIWQDIQGAYGEVDAPTAPTVATGAASVATGSNMDYTWWTLGTRLNWRPVSGLTFSADVVYTQIDADVPFFAYNATTGAAIAGTRNDDGSRWAGRLRIQRDF